MWVLTTLLSYVLNIWLNAPLGNTARILRAGERPPRGAFRTWPRWLRAARRSENRLSCSFLRLCRRTGLFGGKAEGLLCFASFPAQFRGLQNAFGAPPVPPPLAAPQWRGCAGNLPALLPVPAGAGAGSYRGN